MAVDALHLNLPTTITRPAVVDRQLYQPRARLDLQAGRVVEFGTLLQVHAARNVALVEMQRFAEELERVATAAVAAHRAMCTFAATKEHAGATWSDHSLTAAFRFQGDDYDVAEAEEANLRASGSYGW